MGENGIQVLFDKRYGFKIKGNLEAQHYIYECRFYYDDVREETMKVLLDVQRRFLC